MMVGRGRRRPRPLPASSSSRRSARPNRGPGGVERERGTLVLSSMGRDIDRTVGGAKLRRVERGRDTLAHSAVARVIQWSAVVPHWQICSRHDGAAMNVNPKESVRFAFSSGRSVQSYIDETPRWSDGTTLVSAPMTGMQWLIWTLAAAGKFFKGEFRLAVLPCQPSGDDSRLGSLVPAGSQHIWHRHFHPNHPRFDPRPQDGACAQSCRPDQQ